MKEFNKKLNTPSTQKKTDKNSKSTVVGKHKESQIIDTAGAVMPDPSVHTGSSKADAQAAFTKKDKK